MYDFIDTIETASESASLPSEAMQINGQFIEHIIPGYRTLQVLGREALSSELSTYDVGSSDGSRLSNKRYPGRTITIVYQLIAESNEAFREAYNQLGGILNVEDAELIFNDETDKFFIGTPEEMGEVEGGKNSVISEFTIFCADPYKYSVAEYEIEPSLDDENSFLIDYNGTHKSFPILEAEFLNEDESDGALTGSGDCGFVAFFNEDEKIIQLGDPDEVDEETYAKSQTLVSQAFNKLTAWNETTQANWKTNEGRVSSDSWKQDGNVSIQTASYETTVAPSTSGVLLSARSSQTKPYIDYKVSAQASGRKADRINVKFVVTTSLVGGAASVKAGSKVTLKNTKLYSDATTAQYKSTKTGTFYLWDSSTRNGRVRITNSASNVGKAGQVTGWVNVSDVSLQTSAVLGKGYGLKGVIDIGGKQASVIIKSENVAWSGSTTHSVSVTLEAKNIDAETTVLEDIKFKVERTDDKDSKVGLLDETNCKELEISTYTEPTPNTWYLMPESFGLSNGGWHGPSITRTIPADEADEIGAKNFTFTYTQKMSIGNTSSATQEKGGFQVQLVSGSGTSRKIVAGVSVYKGSVGNKAKLRFYLNDKVKQDVEIDLSLYNKYFGNNNAAKGITTVKTSSIKKVGGKVEFNIGGLKKTFTDNAIADISVNEITFMFARYATAPALQYNGLYSAKFIKNNCDTFEDIPNKFSANDIVQADCKSGEIFLNGSPTPSLGAAGNDWEDFYLKKGLNQIGFAYSDWVADEYKPKFKIKYREVFI